MLIVYNHVQEQEHRIELENEAPHRNLDGIKPEEINCAGEAPDAYGLQRELRRDKAQNAPEPEACNEEDDVSCCPSRSDPQMWSSSNEFVSCVPAHLHCTRAHCGSAHVSSAQRHVAHVRSRHHTERSSLRGDARAASAVGQRSDTKYARRNQRNE